MKPRIIILMHYLELGGAEMSLIGLLRALDPAKVDVDLFLYDQRGYLMQYVPEWVRLLPRIAVYSAVERPIVEVLRRGYIGVIGGRLYAKLKHRRFLKRHAVKEPYSSSIQYVGDYVTRWLPEINRQVEYDLCISFLAPHNVARDRVRAKRRVAWIHTDYSTIDIDVDSELKVWSAFDRIVSISPEVTNAFVKTFPSLLSRIVEIENIIPGDYVKSRADAFVPPEFIQGELTLLSIGRYAHQKNFDNIPQICRKLMKLLSVDHFCSSKKYDNVSDIAGSIVSGCITDLKWYIIGYGIEEALIQQKIAEAGMEEHVILLGKKENPYPYIKGCDIYVQPSRFEGKSITVREAQILCKPVAITAYPTAASQIQNGVDGVIVPLDNEGCASGLADFIVDKALQQRVVEYLRTHDYTNTSEVEKIYNLLK